MKRLALIVASGAIGLALLVGVTHEAVATTGGGGQPSDNVPCYYNLYHCSYQDSMAYWSGCDPQYSQGLIPTGTAKVICTVFHAQ